LILIGQHFQENYTVHNLQYKREIWKIKACIAIRHSLSSTKKISIILKYGLYLNIFKNSKNLILNNYIIIKFIEEIIGMSMFDESPYIYKYRIHHIIIYKRW